MTELNCDFQINRANQAKAQRCVIFRELHMTSYSLRACVFVCVKSEVEAEDSMYNEIRLQTDCTQNPVLRNWTVKKKEKKRKRNWTVGDGERV